MENLIFMVNLCLPVVFVNQQLAEQPYKETVVFFFRNLAYSQIRQFVKRDQILEKNFIFLWFEGTQMSEDVSENTLDQEEKEVKKKQKSHPIRH